MREKGFRWSFIAWNSRCLFVLLSLFGWSTSVLAQDYIGKRLESLSQNEIPELIQVKDLAASEQWLPRTEVVPNLGLSNDVKWLRLKVDPRIENGQLIEIQNAGIDELICYMVCDGEIIATYERGVFHETPVDSRIGTYPSFPIPLVECGELQALFRLQSSKPLLIPLRITGPREVLRGAHERDVLFAAYFGVILVMLLYNLFLFLSIGDRSYLEYSIYILMVGGTQLVLNGYAPVFGAESIPWLNLRLTHFFGVFSGLTTIVFAQNFLRLSHYVPWLHKLLNVYFALYLVAFILTIFDLLVWSYSVINFCAGAIFFLIPGAVITMRKGYAPARYFLIAFSVFIAAVVVFVLKDTGLIPYNQWTFFALPLGSAFEVILLSLALASRINQLKREGAKAREEQLELAQVNEKIVRDQNVVLEERVKKRTFELEETNSTMQGTLNELQSAQQQLIQSEKLASIGQLTAGIAHELNNPINFVSSSAQSLRRDFEDLNAIVEAVKTLPASDPNLESRIQDIHTLLGQLDIEFTQQEIEELLNGIEDGANRTSEIVRGLRIFSRMDGDNFIQADINELMNSTLVVLRSNLRTQSQVTADLAADLPQFSCQPGRLNQVFMNIITNAAQATESTDLSLEEREVVVSTLRVESIGQSWIEVRIKDNGLGMDDAVKAQIFDPFFTTKPVGEGTGLGLSIVMGILRDHNAEVDVQSEVGLGTEFIIRFPI
ncbi:MAG: ATP-binding protein [Flavobacteriales bacterium]|nr:ATP-binding protein [Flavobacteriales bacterium]